MRDCVTVTQIQTSSHRVFWFSLVFSTTIYKDKHFWQLLIPNVRLWKWNVNESWRCQTLFIPTANLNILFTDFLTETNDSISKKIYTKFRFQINYTQRKV